MNNNNIVLKIILKMKALIGMSVIIMIWMTSLISCTSKDDFITIYRFPIVEELHHEKISTSPVLYAPVGLLLLDSAVVAMNLNTDTVFQVFKLPSYTHVGGFVRKGEGPDEELYIDPFIQRLENNQFMYRNLTGVKFCDFNPFSETLNIIKNIKLTNELIDVFHTFILNNQIIGTRTDKATDREFVSFNIQTQRIDEYGEKFPIIKRRLRITDIDKVQLFAKANTVKPDGSSFACVYDKFPILRIYSNTGELKKDIRLNNNQQFPYALIEQEPTLEGVNEIMQNYRMIKSSNNYIYALYIGKRNKDISSGLNDFSNIIHVWDWEGNPIKELRLDRNIFTFDVSSDDKYIICSSLELLDGFYKYVLI